MVPVGEPEADRVESIVESLDVPVTVLAQVATCQVLIVRTENAAPVVGPEEGEIPARRPAVRVTLLSVSNAVKSLQTVAPAAPAMATAGRTAMCLAAPRATLVKPAGCTVRVVIIQQSAAPAMGTAGRTAKCLAAPTLTHVEPAE